MEIDEDGPLFCLRHGIDVQRQTVLGAEGEAGVLIRCRGGGGAVPHRPPAGRLSGGCPAVLACGCGPVGDAVPAEGAILPRPAPHRAILSRAEGRDGGEQAVFGWGRSGIGRAERAGQRRCGGCAPFQEAAAGKFT